MTFLIFIFIDVYISLWIRLEPTHSAHSLPTIRTSRNAEKHSTQLEKLNEKAITNNANQNVTSISLSFLFVHLIPGHAMRCDALQYYIKMNVQFKKKCITRQVYSTVNETLYAYIISSHFINLWIPIPGHYCWLPASSAHHTSYCMHTLIHTKIIIIRRK